MDIVITLLALLVLLIIGFVLFAPQLGRKPHGEHLQKIKQSPHYKGEKFENSPVAAMDMNLKKLANTMWEMLRGNPNRRPKKKLPSQQPIFNKESGSYLTWFGHSTFLYEIDGKKILFDPMLGKYASPIPFAVSRYAYDLPSSAKDLPHLDAVIISHDHYDHLDYGTIAILKEKVDRFFMPLGVGSHLQRWGVPQEKIMEFDWWDKTSLGPITITATPSQHFSGRSLNDRAKTLWASWIIESATVKVFFGGDSGYFDGFKKIGERCGPFDLTLLDSGQYNQQWHVVHMFPEESVVAHKELKGRVFMPMHWSAFTLSLHSWNDPAERAVVAAEKENIEMITPMIGERFNVLTDRPKKIWWRE